MHLNLQLFAEGTGGTGAIGGDGGTGAEGAKGENVTAALSQKKGVKINPLANVKYGIQNDEGGSPVSEVKTETNNTTEDRNAKYEAFIKEHKDLDDVRIQNIVQKRLKSSKETVDRYNELTPVLDLISKKYGVDGKDPKAILAAIEADDTFFEEEALKRGMSVEQLKEVNKLERENADFRKQMEAQKSKEAQDKIYAELLDQEKKTKAVYPNFDLKTELQNPKFQKLLSSGIDAKTAFEVIHKDEIIPAAMQYTAKSVEQKIVNNIMANGRRPSENGTSSQGASVVKSDVRQLTRADRQEIIQRVKRGEIIKF